MSGSLEEWFSRQLGHIALHASLVSAAIGVHVCLGAYSGPQALDIPNKASAYLSVNVNILIALCSG